MVAGVRIAAKGCSSLAGQPFLSLRLPIGLGALEPGVGAVRRV